MPGAPARRSGRQRRPMPRADDAGEVEEDASGSVEDESNEIKGTHSRMRQGARVKAPFRVDGKVDMYFGTVTESSGTHVTVLFDDAVTATVQQNRVVPLPAYEECKRGDKAFGYFMGHTKAKLESEENYWDQPDGPWYKCIIDLATDDAHGNKMYEVNYQDGSGDRECLYECYVKKREW